MSDRRSDLLEQAFYRDRNVADTAVGGGRGGILSRLAWRVAFVLAGLLTLDLVLAATLSPVELLPDTQIVVAHYTLKVDRFSAAETPDVLFLGSSRVLDGIVPAIVEDRLLRHWGRTARAYNLGLLNAKLEEYRALARSHIPDPAPRFVVLGFSGTELVHEQRFQHAARFLWRWPDFADWLVSTDWDGFRVEYVEEYLESVLARHWYLYGHRDALRRRLLGRLGMLHKPGTRGAATMTSGAMAGILSEDGMAFRQEWESLADKLRRLPAGVRVPPREMIIPKEIVQGSRFETLRDVIALLRVQGCRVALAEVPPSPYLQKLNPILHGAGVPASDGSPERPGFRTRMQELADELDLPFVPCDAEAAWLVDGFYNDVNHLNEAGAKRFTTRLMDELIAGGFFEP